MGDRGEVARRDLGEIAHHRGHGAPEGISRWRESGRQRIGDVAFRPIFEPRGRYVRGLALSVRQRTPSQPARGDDAAKKTARGMTFGAVPRSLDQITAPPL